MSISNASGETINASSYRNGMKKVALGLNYHLDSNVIHWDCVIKNESDYKNYRNNSYEWHIFIHCKKGITSDLICRHDIVLHELKDEKITPLKRCSNMTEWFCVRGFHSRHQLRTEFVLP